jgi:cell division transport system permease protein
MLKFFRLNTELPFDRDASSLFIPWIMGAMIFLATTIMPLSLVVTTLVGLAAIATISFMSHTGLRVHKKVIEILHLIGATNDYIARQFQNYALRLGMQGAVIGLSLSAICLYFMKDLLGQLSMPFIPSALSSEEMVWVMFATPVAGIILTAFSARLSVLSVLGRRVR